MKNTQKGFTKVALLIIVIATLASGGYFILSKQDYNQAIKPIKERNWQGGGAGYLPDEADHIQVLYPKGGEKLEIGKTYDIRWENYVDGGTDPLNITLQSTTPDNKLSSKIIASNVPAVSTGSYKWIVTSENPENKYKVEVYPAGGRELVGRSKEFFTIYGEQLITITSPKPNDRINLTQPIIITGKARNVFGEGEFDISASYLLDNKKQVVARTFATCSINGDGCDWTSGNFLDFKATLDLSSTPACSVNVEFFKRDEKNPTTEPFYVLPLNLFGNEECR